MWNVEKWYRRLYLRGSSGEIDIKNRLIDMGRGEESVRCMERVTWKHITICKIDSRWEFAVWLRKLKRGLYQSREVGWGRRWEGGSKEKGYM